MTLPTHDFSSVIVLATYGLCQLATGILVSCVESFSTGLVICSLSDFVWFSEVGFVVSTTLGKLLHGQLWCLVHSRWV